MQQSIQSSRPNPMKHVLARRDFRLLWIGQLTSLLGDQFYLIATPWLVLNLTGNPIALGAVMAVGAIPRALMILIGGAITDRLSPRRIMLASDALRLGLILGLVGLVATNHIQIWMLYVFSLLFGVIAGFFIPAANTVVPYLLPAEDLQAGNSIFQGSSQLTGFVGPALAGVVIGAFAGKLSGMAAAYTIDAVTFIISVITLWLMSSDPQVRLAKPGENIWGSIRSGMRYTWNDGFLRLVVIIIAFANLLFAGPLMVGVPVLAKQHLAGGAMAYGLLLSSYAGGNLGGILLSGVLPKLSSKRMKQFLVGLLFMFGIGLTLLGQITTTWMGFVLLLILGLGNGYNFILLITGLQRRTPKEMMGRLMSLVMLANLGMMPLSQALAGVLSSWNVGALFALSGLGMLVLDAWMIGQAELEHASAVLSGTPVPVPAAETR